MAGPKHDHTKSVRERQISYDITYMWNFKKWIYLQNRNRDTDVENKHGYQKMGGGRRDKLGD